MGATANVSASGATPALPATHAATSSVGSVRPSSTSTPRLGVLRVAELPEQLPLHARFRAQRARTHREESLRVDRPAGVLRRHAGLGRMVGPHLHAGPRLAADRERRERDVPEAAHAQLGERRSRGEAAGHVDAGVDDRAPPASVCTAMRSSAARSTSRSASAHARSFIPRSVNLPPPGFLVVSPVPGGPEGPPYTQHV